jgi:hypothetical protein
MCDFYPCLGPRKSALTKIRAVSKSLRTSSGLELGAFHYHGQYLTIFTAKLEPLARCILEPLALQADFSSRCKSLQAANEQPASTEPQPSTTASSNMHVTEVTEPQEKKTPKSSSIIYARVNPATLERFNGMRRTLGLEHNEDLVTRLMDCYEQLQAKLKEPMPSKLAEATEDIRQNRIEPHMPITVFKDPQGLMHFSVKMPRLLFACVKKTQRTGIRAGHKISFDTALSLMLLYQVCDAMLFRPDDRVVQALGEFLIHGRLDKELVLGFLQSGAQRKHGRVIESGPSDGEDDEHETDRLANDNLENYETIETTFGVAKIS